MMRKFLQPTPRITLLGVTHSVKSVSTSAPEGRRCAQNNAAQVKLCHDSCSPTSQQLRARDAFVITQSVNFPAAQPDANEKLLSAELQTA
jgi:hypothetical protein